MEKQVIDGFLMTELSVCKNKHVGMASGMDGRDCLFSVPAIIIFSTEKFEIS